VLETTTDLAPQTLVIDIVLPAILKSFTVQPLFAAAFSLASRNIFAGLLAVSTMAGV
jgi:hypothetical protein